MISGEKYTDSFDLERDRFYLLLAEGPVDQGTGTINIHRRKVVSAAGVALGVAANVEGASRLFILVLVLVSFVSNTSLQKMISSFSRTPDAFKVLGTPVILVSYCTTMHQKSYIAPYL